MAKEVMRQLPREKVIYFGDTARAPYGPRTPEEVRLFTEQIVDYLIQYKPKMVVIACNTATAAALDYIADKISIPVIGVIRPGARAAISATKTGHVGVIGTAGTIQSEAYPAALRELSPFIDVVSDACPTLVPLVEQGMFDSVAAQAVVRKALIGIKKFKIDTLILGCTHYPFLRDAIQEEMGPKVKLISSADETAREISTVLYQKGQLATADETPIHQFFCSGDAEMFQSIAHSWLGEQIMLTPVVWQFPVL
ncbi:glutamate racemase [Paenibacillus shirakamiensis]|uniref:Glutamate racemase n=1 Tax=Paenibacillus shirakamiensis TaxID=1265935 RepID=A0ABS4JHY7_9BACL|nr:glutamate racemase [Paenibacillus shirakamiensis]